MPEFIGLRRGTFAIAVANDDKCGRLGFFDEGDGRAFGVNVGIVVNGFAEKWNHPLIDFVFTVVALIICDARPGHGSFEAVGLRNGPHGHVAAVTPASDAETIRIDGCGFERFIDAGQNITKIAITKIAHVGAGEAFTLAETAARVRHQDKISGRSERESEIAAAGPSGKHCSTRATVNFDDHRIFFR